MANELEIVEVSVGIVYRNGRFVATQRPEGKHYAGYWELPGGKKEANETCEEALCRELAEELGIKVLEYQFLKKVSHHYPELNYITDLHFYIVSKFEGEPTSSMEDNLRWITCQETDEIDFLPPDKKLLHSFCLWDINRLKNS